MTVIVCLRNCKNTAENTGFQDTKGEKGTADDKPSIMNKTHLLHFASQKKKKRKKSGDIDTNNQKVTRNNLPIVNRNKSNEASFLGNMCIWSKAMTELMYSIRVVAPSDFFFIEKFADSLFIHQTKKLKYSDNRSTKNLKSELK